MKKKTLSLALALAMCLSLTVPAFAEEDPDAPMSVEEGLKMSFWRWKLAIWSLKIFR